MRCYVVIFLVLGFSSLTACGRASNGAFGPQVQTGSVRPLSDVLYNFGQLPDAEFPSAGLLAGKKGEYYGTTVDGGSYNCYGGYGCGTVYEITAAGKEKVLYSFQGVSDGMHPQSTLIMDKEGALYGTTPLGGIHFDYCPPNGCGLVFKLTPGKQGWTESVLYEFDGVDGHNPYGGLLMTKSGALLGTTYYGGAGGGGNGDGLIFELVPTGSTYSENTVHAFTGIPDGANPTDGLVSDSSGNLYGTTSSGGQSGKRRGRGSGTVFKLTPSGSTYTESVIYRFTGGADGHPHASLLPGPSGVLYGLTDGSLGIGNGTVFELLPSGSHYREKVLYSFKGGSDGSDPDDTPGLVADGSGNLYGTTVHGGGSTGCTNGCGTVFKLVPSTRGFTESVLYAFQGSPDGANPYGSVVIGNDGNLLGPTYSGGSSNVGSIFSIAP